MLTQFDEADITELEAFRKESSAASEKQGFKLTMLAFLIKACIQWRAPRRPPSW